MQKTCQKCRNNFTVDSEDQAFYRKMNVPEPTFCPWCRFIRRMAYRNERKLFRVKDAFSGEMIFSLYPEESGRKVVTQEEWFSDAWNAEDYGRNFDFSRDFYSQLMELDTDVPIYNLNVKNMVRSSYSGNASDMKDCYLVFNASGNENCLYGNGIDKCTDVVDNSHIHSCQRTYESVWLTNCYRAFYSLQCSDSQDIWFSRDCVGVNNCIGCTNLRKVSYCIFNEQYSKEEYESKFAEFQLHTRAGVEAIRKQAEKIWAANPVREHQGIKNLGSNGVYVTQSKNVRDSFLIREGENLRYCQYMQFPTNKDCYDACIWGQNTQLCHETSVCGENAYGLKFCWDCWPNTRDSEYCAHLKSCSNCFGCVGLKNKEYCIFNKQYTKEEYELLVNKIKKHMDDMPYVAKDGSVYRYGEFFPTELCPFGYNNTIALEHEPITHEQAQGSGYSWIEIPKGSYAITKTSEQLPQSAVDATDSILNEVIECGQCKNAFRIVAGELSFLQKEKLPLPVCCADCRTKNRIAQRLPNRQTSRVCACKGASAQGALYQNKQNHQHGADGCGKHFVTGYEKGAIVYCEQCYQQEFS